MRGRAMGNQDYDFIIVGAGSAGCALAARLTREASYRVLLLEAGPRDRHPMVSVPLGFAMLMKHPKLNWCYETEPEPHMNGQRMAWPRGKLLGGSAPSTAWCTSAASGKTTTAGRPMAARAGPGRTCCPGFSAASTTSTAPANGTAPAGRCGWTTR